MIAHFADNKSTVQSWMNSYNQTCPSVCREDGANSFTNAVSYNAGGPTYIVRPDKSWDRTSNYAKESDITSEGITPHNCSVSNDNKSVFKNQANNLIASCTLNKNGLIVDISKKDIYRISIFTADGKLLRNISKDLSIGNHNLSFGRNSISNGIYIIDIKGSQKSFRTKLIVN